MENRTAIRELKARIEALRKHLLALLDQKGDLMDEEVISTSKELDLLIVRYCRTAGGDDTEKVTCRE